MHNTRLKAIAQVIFYVLLCYLVHRCDVTYRGKHDTIQPGHYPAPQDEAIIDNSGS